MHEGPRFSQETSTRAIDPFRTSPMGYQDRHYSRPRTPGDAGASWEPGARAGGFRMSATLWIIAINVAVFVVDALLGARGIGFAQHIANRENPGVRFDEHRLATVGPAPNRLPPYTYAEVRIVDRDTHEPLGVAVYEGMPPLKAIGHFSTAKVVFGLEVWRLVTFQFLHADLTHLAFNMLGLWFFAPVVEQALKTAKRFIAYYLICGIAGAILYLALNLAGYLVHRQVPGLLFYDMQTPLIGASAGVFGILVAAAYIAPNAELLMLYVIPMKVRTGAYIMVGLALLNLLRTGANAGGDAAHVGGALAGFFFIRRPELLRDFFDVFGPRGSSRRAPGPLGATRRNARRLDQLLDKVHDHGLHSLTDEEREFLRAATEEKRASG